MGDPVGAQEGVVMLRQIAEDLRLIPLLLSGLAVIGGITLLANPWENTVMSRLAGILLIYYGVTELLSTRRMTRAREEYEIRYAGKSEATAAEPVPETDLTEVKDVPYEKVDDPQETGFWTSNHTGE